MVVQGAVVSDNASPTSHVLKMPRGCCWGRCSDRGVARAVLSCQTDGPDHKDCKALDRSVAKLKAEVRAQYEKKEQVSLKVF